MFTSTIIKETFGEQCILEIMDNSLYFDNTQTIGFENEHSIIWISPKNSLKNEIVLQTPASFVVCDFDLIIPEKIKKKKCFIRTNNPRLFFLRLINKLFVPKFEYTIHPTAQIHPEAKLHKDVYIGPFVSIGKCEIGKNSIIYGNTFVYDQVFIGENVTIHAGTIIGADGFGYERNEDGVLEKFPHIGGVIIEDGVEIGANTCIDKGSLGNTVIKKNVKIDNLVHIAHNVEIGENTVVIANSVVGGSTKIDKNSWIAPSVTLRDSIKIGNNVTVGLGAVVLKNIPDNQVWVGNPAALFNNKK